MNTPELADQERWEREREREYPCSRYGLIMKKMFCWLSQFWFNGYKVSLKKPKKNQISPKNFLLKKHFYKSLFCCYNKLERDKAATKGFFKKILFL